MGVENNVKRKAGAVEFDYGEHTIRVTVHLVYCWRHKPLNAFRSKGFHRWVKVEAIHEGNVETENGTFAYLEREPNPKVRDYLRALLSDDQSPDELWHARESPLVPPLDDQIEQTTRPVFKELDYIYEHVSVDYNIDVEASVERVKHDTSWVEIDDEFDRLVSEIDSLATATE